MNERYLLRVIDCLKHTFGIVAFSQCACWTVNYALAANDAAGFLNALFTFDVDGCVDSSVRDIPNAKCLDFLAHLNTPKTLDALIVVANEWKCGVPCFVRKIFLIRL